MYIVVGLDRSEVRWSYEETKYDCTRVECFKLFILCFVLAINKSVSYQKKTVLKYYFSHFTSLPIKKNSAGIYVVCVNEVLMN